MNLRKTLLVPLVLAAGACGRQDAAPFVAPDIKAFQKSTGTVQVVVRRDTAVSTTTPKFAVAGATTATGQTQFELVKASDPTFLAGRASTDAAGIVTFTGIAPGQYLLKPVLRTGSTSNVAAAGQPITVVAGDTVTPSDTVRIKLSTRISGTVATEFVDQQRFKSIKHGGVKILIFRETGDSTNVFNLVDSTTSNAVGSYEFFVAPGPGRVRMTFNSGDISNFKDSTTFSGLLPVPYVRPRVETITLTRNFAATTNPPAPADFTSGIEPGRDITQAISFNYPTVLRGIVFRDRNNSGVRDSAPILTPKEGLIGGDTVVIQLRDSTDSRVLRTATAATATTTSNTSSANTFTFSPSVAPGKYVLRLDKLASRFTSNPLEFPVGPAYEVFIAAPSTGIVNATCRPYVAPPAVNTATFGNCNFGLQSGK